MAYYYIIQKINQKKYTNEIEEPASIKDIQKLVTILAGNVSVFRYQNDNSYEDLTELYGKKEDVDFSKLYKIKAIKYTKIHSIENNEEIGEFFLNNLFVYSEKNLPRTLKYRNTICRYRSLHHMSKWDFFEEEKDKNTLKGTKYEKFIAQKYLNLGYEIKYNGIEKGVKDEGLDLIAYNKGKTILIQCKNWKENEYAEICAKDLQSFFGACFKYVLENSLADASVGFHYIVANELSMTKSALLYLEENRYIKYKCVPFEKNSHV